MRRRDDEGFTLIEVIVAIGIMALTVFSIVQVMASVSVKTTSSLMRDRAEQLANEVVERAQAFGCGLDVGTEGAAPGGLLARREANCFSAANFTNFDRYAPVQGFVDSASMGAPTDGDSTWTTTVGGFHYSVRFQTSWQQVGQPGVCPGIGGAGGNDPAGADGIALTVTVGWLDYRTVRTFTVDDYEAVPPDATTYHDLSRGAILFRFSAAQAAQPQLVTLSVHPVGSPIEVVSRYSDANGCAFFPFLPPTRGALSGNGMTNASSSWGTATVTDSSYTYTVNGGVGGTEPTVSPSAVEVVTE